MEKTFKSIVDGYQRFRKKYIDSDNTIMQNLAHLGQRPKTMVIACCDSRVDPALILQCDPGDLFVVRNVANIVPPFESDERHHGTSAALEFGVCYLQVKHIIILGHSQCGGIKSLLERSSLKQNDFITNWVSQIKVSPEMLLTQHPNEVAKEALINSYQNCLTFPWINEKVNLNQLSIHLWFFDIKDGEIFAYSFEDKNYHPLINDYSEHCDRGESKETVRDTKSAA